MVEAALFSAVASGCILATVALITRNSYQMGMMNVRTARDNISTKLRAQMADPSVCTRGYINGAALTGAVPAKLELGFTFLDGSQVVAGMPYQPDHAITIRSLRIENAVATGFTGASGFPIQLGNLVLEVGGFSKDQPALAPVTLGQMFIETSPTAVVGCFNNFGPYGVAALACLQMNGVNGTSGTFGTNASTCNTTAFQNAVNTTIHGQVDTELQGTYWNYLMGQTDGRIALTAAQTLQRLVQNAHQSTDGATAQQTATITAGFAASNSQITASDQSRQTQINNLTSAVAGNQATANAALAQAQAANALANQALTQSNSAVSASNSALTASQSAVNTSNLANSYAQSSLATAQSALNTSNNALNAANSALYVAGVATSIGQNAFNTANSAASIATAAANTAQQANNYASSAYSTASSNYNSALNSYNTANWANSTSQNAYNQAAGAVGTANYADSLAHQAYSRGGGNVTIGVTDFDCSRIYASQCP